MLKSTGVLRRVDELGRIVIPKEIRKNLKIKNGESLEIFIDSDSVVLKKFSYMSDLNDIAQKCSDSFYDVIKKDIFITDTDNVIASSGNLKKKYLNKELSRFICDLISKRKPYLENEICDFELISNSFENCRYFIAPVVVNGDAAGSVIIATDSAISEYEQKESIFIAKFLGKHLE